MKYLTKNIIIVTVAIVVLLGFVGYRWFLYRPAVTVVKAELQEIRGQVKGPGTVQSRVPVTVSAKITGIVEKLYVDQGDRVQKGALLAELDAAELKAKMAAAKAARLRAQRELQRAQAEVNKAQANLALARSNYRRDEEVFKPGYISAAAMDTTRAQLRLAESEAAAAQALVASQTAQAAQADSEVKASEAFLHYTRILAPMDGLITARRAEVGSTVAPGAPILQMVDLDSIWVATWIDASQLAQLQEGQTAAIRLRSGREYQGQVARITREADTVTRELEVDVTLGALPQPLAIGEEADVTIFTGRQKAPAIPLNALQYRQEQTGILMVQQGRLTFRPVTVGVNDGKKAAILQGLQEGDLVVVDRITLKPGTAVQPVSKAPGSGGQ